MSRKKSVSKKEKKKDKKGKIMEIINIDDMSSEDIDIPKKTTEWMTKYEYTQLVACRSLQLSQGMIPLIDIKGDYNTLSIAERELNARVIPLCLCRILPDGTEEFWDPNKMHIMNY